MSRFIIVKSDREKECIDLDEVCAVFKNEDAIPKCDKHYVEHEVYTLSILFKNGKRETLNFSDKDVADRVFNQLSGELMK